MHPASTIAGVLLILVFHSANVLAQLELPKNGGVGGTIIELNNPTVTFKSSTGKIYEVVLEKDQNLTVDGVAKTFADLKSGDTITITTRNSKLTKVVVTSKRAKEINDARRASDTADRTKRQEEEKKRKAELKEKAEENVGLKTEFNEIRGTTVITANKFDVADRKLRLEAYVLFTNPTSVKPIFSLMFSTSSSSDWKYLHSYSVVMLIDGKDRASPNSRRSGIVGSSYVSELIFVDLNQSEMNKLADATEVKMEVGTTKFALDQEQIALIRKLRNAAKREIERRSVANPPPRPDSSWPKGGKLGPYGGSREGKQLEDSTLDRK